MKNNILLFSLLSIITIASLKAQQLVSTTPSNRNALIEEYTGRNCGYCPDGHRIANELMQHHPDKVWAVNIHTGGFAPTNYPNLNTTVGAIYASDFSIESFPSGIVNRTTSFGLDRNQWSSYVNTQIAQQAEVNIGGDMVYNPDTHTIDLTVELYYTANSAESTNYLTIYMVQDSIIGSQAGSNYNPSQVLSDGQYCHMHVLRDILTPFYGEAVTPTTAGTLITKNYTYEIPESIGDPNGVEVDVHDIFFIAFVTEKYQGNPTRPILNVCKIAGLEPLVYNVSICEGESYNENGFNINNPAVGNYYEEYYNEEGRCVKLYLAVYPTFTRNLYNSICEGESFNYGPFHFDNPSVGVHTQENVLQSVHGCDSVIVMNLTVHPSYNVELTAEICEGEDYKENGFNLNNLAAGIYNETRNLETEEDCDSIINLTLTVHEAPEVVIDGNTQINAGESTTLTASGADSYEWSTGETTASITVSPESTTNYSVVGTTNGCETETEVTVNVTVGVGENDFSMTKIYPNPTEGELKIECMGMKEITVIMPNGQTLQNIMLSDDTYTLDMSEFKSGVYYLKITTDNGSKVFKTVKQ
ncbi:MAG: Omp28-related outer membrane protein [Bacteroidales bacterium]|nr:Omp28-related outer membrane protein [Bacteroidales bacterium]